VSGASRGKREKPKGEEERSVPVKRKKGGKEDALLPSTKRDPARQSGLKKKGRKRNDRDHKYVWPCKRRTVVIVGAQTRAWTEQRRVEGVAPFLL